MRAMARKVDIRFILEWHQPGKDIRRMVIPPVSRYVLTLEPATDREWTFGDEPVKQKMGYREGRISIAGVAGYKRRKGYDANGVELVANGVRLFEEFVKFLEEYENEGKRTEGPIDGNTAERARLVFRSMLDTATNEAWYVEVASFVPVRDVQNARLIRAFTLELTIEGKVVEQRAARLVGTPAQQLGGQAKIADQLAQGIEKAPVGPDALTVIDENFVGDSAAGRVARDGVRLSSLQDFVNEVPVRWTKFRLPVEDFLQTCRSMKEAVGAVKDAMRFPTNLINDVADSARGATEVIESIYDAIPGADKRADAREVFVDVYGTIESMRASALAQLGLEGFRYDPGGSSVNPSPQIPGSATASGGVEVVSARIESGETLPAFCFRVLGDPTRWPEIMELNHLSSPFAGPDGEPLSGLRLLVPAPQGLAGERDPNVLFGVDVHLEGRYIVLNGTKDFALVRGKANLVQGLTRRITLIMGSNLAVPKLGMPELVGQPGVAGTAAFIASQVQEQLLRDGRIRRVYDVRVTQRGGYYTAEFTVETVAGESLPITAPFAA